MNRILAALYLLACAAFAADEKPAPPQNFTHRITGLFSPDRETALRTALEKVPGVALVSVDFEHAEGVFSYDPAIAFKGTKPEDITKRFDELLRNATRSTLGIAALHRAVQYEESADIITISTHIGIENDGNGDTRLLALCPRGVHAEHPARSESKGAKQSLHRVWKSELAVSSWSSVRMPPPAFWVRVTMAAISSRSAKATSRPVE